MDQRNTYSALPAEIAPKKNPLIPRYLSESDDNSYEKISSDTYLYESDVNSHKKNPLILT